MDDERDSVVGEVSSDESSYSSIVIGSRPKANGGGAPTVEKKENSGEAMKKEEDLKEDLKEDTPEEAKDIPKDANPKAEVPKDAKKDTPKDDISEDAKREVPKKRDSGPKDDIPKTEDAKRETVEKVNPEMVDILANPKKENPGEAMKKEDLKEQTPEEAKEKDDIPKDAIPKIAVPKDVKKETPKDEISKDAKREVPKKRDSVPKDDISKREVSEDEKREIPKREIPEDDDVPEDEGDIPDDETEDVIGEPVSGGRSVLPWLVGAGLVLLVAVCIGRACLEDPKVIDVKDLEDEAKRWTDGKALSVLFIGKAGTGKSTLARSLFEEADFGVHIKRSFWQIAHLERKTELEAADLIVYTIKMDDTRFRPEDEDIIHKLSKSFGNGLWNRSIVALTFTNQVSFIDQQGKEQKSETRFLKKRRAWKERILKVLSESGIKSEVLKDIPFAPVGHPSELELYGEPWTSHFVQCILVRMRGRVASGGLWKSMRHHVDSSPSNGVIKCVYE